MQVLFYGKKQVSDKIFAAVLILVLAVNAAVLHFGFGIRISTWYLSSLKPSGTVLQKSGSGGGRFFQKGGQFCKKRIEKGDDPSEMQAGRRTVLREKSTFLRQGTVLRKTGSALAVAQKAPTTALSGRSMSLR